MKKKQNSIRTPLAKAKGKGSAHDGLHHWVLQRITAIALIPLSVWFVYSVVNLLGAEHADAVLFLQNPLNALLMAFVIIAGCWHGALGLQVIIEDYITCKCFKIFALLKVKLGMFVLAAASVLSIAKIALA